MPRIRTRSGVGLIKIHGRANNCAQSKLCGHDNFAQVNHFGYPGTVFLRRAFRRPCCVFCFGVSWKLAS